MHEDRPHSLFWTIYFELLKLSNCCRMAVHIESRPSTLALAAVWWRFWPSILMIVHFYSFCSVQFEPDLENAIKYVFLYENDLFYTNCFAILKSGRFVQRQKRPSLCRFWLIQWCPYEINVQLTTIYMLTISWLPADFHLRT